jgi:hypothetical protein
MTETRVSADGRFRWHDDLGVWEPIAPIPAGVTTPDGRYRWDGARWHVNLAAWKDLETAEEPSERGTLPRAQAWVAGISTTVLVLLGSVIVVFVVLLAALVAVSSQVNQK